MKQQEVYDEVNAWFNDYHKRAYTNPKIRYFDKEFVPMDMLEDRKQLAKLAQMLRKYVTPAKAHAKIDEEYEATTNADQ